jgi:TetR/AcrR family transcriptional repressor of nem operon
LCDASVTPLHRIANYIDEAIAGLEKYQFKRGCLMGNLGQELAGLDEVFRLRIAAVFERWTELLSACLSEAQACGELDAELDSTAVADFFWTGWEGAILRAKLDRSTRAVLQFRQMLFDHVLLARR